MKSASAYDAAWLEARFLGMGRPMDIQNKLFIGRMFVDAADGTTMEVLNLHDTTRRDVPRKTMRGYTEPKSVWVNVDTKIFLLYPR